MTDTELREAIATILDEDHQPELNDLPLADQLLALFQSEKQQLLAEILEKLPEIKNPPIAARPFEKGEAFTIGRNTAILEVTAVLEGYQKQGKGGEK